MAGDCRGGLWEKVVMGSGVVPVEWYINGATVTDFFGRIPREGNTKGLGTRREGESPGLE